jgi:hypothetical protein
MRYLKRGMRGHAKVTVEVEVCGVHGGGGRLLEIMRLSTTGQRLGLEPVMNFIG